MKVYGKSSIHEFLGDRVVYRNLTPADKGLPSLDQLRTGLDIAPGKTPRKSEEEYSRVIAQLLRLAQTQDDPGIVINRLVYIGDTRMLDGTAFQNISLSGNWPGIAFICSEDNKPFHKDIVQIRDVQSLFLSNRWDGLSYFDEYCSSYFPITFGTAVVIDLDKTALGARGRNSQVIDQARIQAVFETVLSLLKDDDKGEKVFRQAYETLNQPDFHAFTADNQDYLVYICLIIGSGLFELTDVIQQVQRGHLVDFQDFIELVDRRVKELSPGLQRAHQDIYSAVLTGDPTPFKTFRRNEYLATISRFGHLPDNAPLADLMNQEILITHEVRQVALFWRQRGALLFGLSDKPDEASFPTIELANQGYKPLHRAITHVVGT